MKRHPMIFESARDAGKVLIVATVNVAAGAGAEVARKVGKPWLPDILTWVQIFVGLASFVYIMMRFLVLQRQWKNEPRATAKNKRQQKLLDADDEAHPEP